MKYWAINHNQRGKGLHPLKAHSSMMLTLMEVYYKELLIIALSLNSFV